MKNIKKGKVTPFVGSGVSLGVCPGLFPSWPGLIRDLIGDLTEETKDADAQIVDGFLKKGDLMAAASQAFDALGPSRFSNAMRARFSAPQPSNADLTVAEAIWNLANNIVITTNYDDVLRWAKPKARVLCNDQIPELIDLQGRVDTHNADTHPTIWHLHGHHERADSIVFARDQYAALYENPHSPNPSLKLLETLMLQSTLLFVGFGMRDKYFLDFLMKFVQLYRSNTQPCFAIQIDADGSDKLWEDYNVEVVKVPNFAAGLKSCLASLASTARATLPATALPTHKPPRLNSRVLASVSPTGRRAQK